MSPIRYLLAYLIPLLAINGYLMGGLATFAVLVVAFLVIPQLDLIIGEDASNVTREPPRQLEAKQSFWMITLGYVPVQVVLLLWAASAFTQMEESWLERSGLLFSVGICHGAIGIAMAYEVFHQKNRQATLAGQRRLLTVGYLHFYIEHLIGPTSM